MFNIWKCLKVPHQQQEHVLHLKVCSYCMYKIKLDWAENVLQSQIYNGDPRTCTIFIPAWGSNWESLNFSRIQNNYDSSSVYATCIYCDLSMKVSTGKTSHGTQRLWTHSLCICFCLWSTKTWRYPIWAPLLTTPLHGVVYKVWELSVTTITSLVSATLIYIDFYKGSLHIFSCT